MGHHSVWAGGIPEALKQSLFDFEKEDHRYRNLDPAVIQAIIVARHAMNKIPAEGKRMGVNFGSSRGTTFLFEHHHEYFLKHHKAETLASPTTTPGNLSSWVANDLKIKGIQISHSVTCSTGLHSLLNGIAWMKAGMSDCFLAGASEYPTTDFTIAQMQALKIYSRETGEYPCRALDLTKTKNSMVLGEGACVLVIKNGITDNAIALIAGVGYASEVIEHDVAVSEAAACIQDAMLMAMGDLPPSEVDAVVMHAPGTVKGDAAEFAAIKKVFGMEIPLLTSNKWIIGHTLGTSGLLSAEMAILMMQHQQFISSPFYNNQWSKKNPARLKNILVNAFGFGGNAVSVLLTLPEKKS